MISEGVLKLLMQHVYEDSRKSELPFDKWYKEGGKAIVVEAITRINLEQVYELTVNTAVSLVRVETILSESRWSPQMSMVHNQAKDLVYQITELNNLLETMITDK